MKTIPRLLIALFLFLLIAVLTLILGDPYLPGVIFFVSYIIILSVTRPK